MTTVESLLSLIKSLIAYLITNHQSPSTWLLPAAGHTLTLLPVQNKNKRSVSDNFPCNEFKHPPQKKSPRTLSLEQEFLQNAYMYQNVSAYIL